MAEDILYITSNSHACRVSCLVNDNYAGHFFMYHEFSSASKEELDLIKGKITLSFIKFAHKYHLHKIAILDRGLLNYQDLIDLELLKMFGIEIDNLPLKTMSSKGR